jgi:hypothetical protein
MSIGCRFQLCLARVLGFFPRLVFSNLGMIPIV